ncbi:MAG: ABC transporter substrate-binding protein [Clostridia bacterium]|nr:ABC transporter substrate-binding protein [Clostridia bacterium]
MKLKKILAVVLSLLMVLSFAACTKAPVDEGNSEVDESNVNSENALTFEKEGVIKIGGIGPLTGDAALYGNAVKYGAELAVKEINAKGGINGYEVEYKMEDDMHDAEKSVNAYGALKDWGMQMLMGTVTSVPCTAVSNEAANDNMFLLTPSGSAVECLQAGDTLFRVCFSDPNQGIASADYIANNNVAKKIGIIFNSSDVYSTGIKDKFVEQAAAKNLEIVATEAFTNDSATDFTAQLTNIKSKGAELVFLPIYTAPASLILQQANTMGFAPIFFGCDGLDGILSVENFDAKLAEGVMLLTPFVANATDAATVNFVKGFKEISDEKYLNQFAADAYDAIYAIKAAAEKANVTPEMDVEATGDAMKAAMVEISIDGVTGAGITWTADGEPSKEPKAVKIVNGEYVAP